MLIDGLYPATVAMKAAALAAINKQKSIDYLATSFASIPGVPAKFSQILSMKLDNLPQQEGEVFIEPLDLSIIVNLLKESSLDLFNMVDEIDPVGLTASLGQVHKVKLKTGEVYALKFQYPKLREQVKGQLGVFFKLAALSPAKKFGLEVADYEKKFTQILSEELNYAFEAKGQDEFYKSYINQPEVVVPKVIKEWTTKTLLVQEWVESEKVDSFISSSGSMERAEVATILVRMLVSGLFVNNKLHCDFHQENWGVNRDSEIKIVLYDYGTILDIPPQYAKALLKLIRTFLYKEYEHVKPFNYLVYLGFDPEKLSHIAGRLPTLCEKLFEPLTSDRSWDLETWDIGEHFDKVLGADKWWFRTAGPTWFFLLLKAISGMMSGLKSLKVKVNIHRVFLELTQNLDADVEVPDLSSQFPESNVYSDSCASTLKVKLIERGREKVNISLPVATVDDIEEYIPESAIGYIKENDINLSETVAKVQRSVYLPQSILETKGDQELHIYLE